MPNFQAIKISKGIMWPGYMGTIMNLQIVSNTQKIPTYPKIPEIENFKPQKIL